MKNYVTSALQAIEARRADGAWSRLDRQPLGYPTLEATPGEDATQMRQYLAAQTSQTV